MVGCIKNIPNFGWGGKRYYLFLCSVFQSSLHLQITSPLETVEDEVFVNVYRHLESLGTITTLTSILSLEIESTIRNILVPKFWKHFTPTENETPKVKLDIPVNTAAFSDPNALFFTFIYAIDELYNSYECLELIKPRLLYLNKKPLSAPCLENTQKTLHNALLAQLPPSFNNFVGDFYSIHFRLFTKDLTLSLNTLGM